MNRFILPLAAALTAFGTTASHADQPLQEPLTKVTLQLQWHHQFQFAGYYAAKAKGFFADAGIDIDIVAGGPGTEVVEAVVHGPADFGVSSAELIVWRAKGYPVVALAPIFQHSPYALISLRDSGFDHVQALADQPVMMEANAAELLVFMRDEGVPIGAIDLRPHTHDLQPLIDGEVAAMSAYVTDEPFELHDKGFAYNVITPRAGGIDFYGDTLFTSEQMFEMHPEIVEAFRLASLRGWEYALEHPAEIVDLILEEYSEGQTRAHLFFEADGTRRLILPDIIEIGHSNVGRWQHIADIFDRAGMLPGEIDMEEFLYAERQRLPRWARITIMVGTVGIVVFAAMAIATGYMALRLKREVIGRAKAQEDLERLAATDPLTNLHNRRSFFEHVDRELGRAQRNGQFPGFVILDIDHFKKVNDAHGHPAGDAVLRGLAQCLRDSVRAGDLVARLGGEEFGILLPESDADSALQVAERARAAIASRQTVWNDSRIEIQASFGVTAARTGDRPESLYLRADQALMQAKTNGRNRVVKHDPPAENDPD